jgi:hypothetical protein
MSILRILIGASLTIGVLAVGVLTVGIASAADVKTNPEFARRASWKLPTAHEVRDSALAWLATRDVEPGMRAQVEMLWASVAMDGGEAHLLDLVAATLAAGDPQARELVAVCTQPRREIPLPAVAWLADEKTASFERDNLRLMYGRWLAQEALYDEALEQLSPLKTEQVVDPAGLLFFQAVVHHRTLNRDAGMQAIARLLENEAALPKRYTSVARLMQADLEGLKDESLDHIARRMDDIRRRLDLGRAGPKVREVEDGVIASLDKLIEDMEKQQQAAAAAAAKAGRGTARPSSPLPDSRPIELKGPGEVAKKPIGDKSGWGNLPPHERQEALQQIGKDFPAHYRDVIEQYFRKLASESGENPDK